MHLAKGKSLAFYRLSVRLIPLQPGDVWSLKKSESFCSAEESFSGLIMKRQA